MPIRCKLISPTNLMLERPMYSPVEENEFVVLGVKEYLVSRHNCVMAGAICGAVLVALMAALIFVIHLGKDADQRGGLDPTPAPLVYPHPVLPLGQVVQTPIPCYQKPTPRAIVAVRGSYSVSPRRWTLYMRNSALQGFYSEVHR